MNTIEQISNLPDQMPPEDIKTWFYTVIEEHKKGELKKYDALEAFRELSDRQWHAYELINQSVKADIENWIEKNWENTVGFLDRVAGIIGMLGLNKSYDIVKRLKRETTDEELKDYIDDLINEYGDDVSDPYKSLRK